MAPVGIHEQFVHVPRVAQASLPTPEDPGVRRPEPPTPRPNRLVVGDGEAPLREQVVGIAEAQTEPVAEPDGGTDDLRRESVAAVADVPGRSYATGALGSPGTPVSRETERNGHRNIGARPESS